MESNLFILIGPPYMASVIPMKDFTKACKCHFPIQLEYPIPIYIQFPNLVGHSIRNKILLSVFFVICNCIRK